MFGQWNQFRRYVSSYEKDQLGESGDPQTLKPIQWKFIPPIAARWDGWWEQLMRSTKELLVPVLGKLSVNYEELCTILCNAEAVLNNCPLTYVSDDISDLAPLTPSMFFQDLKQTGDWNSRIR